VNVGLSADTRWRGPGFLVKARRDALVQKPRRSVRFARRRWIPRRASTGRAEARLAPSENAKV